MDDLRERAIIEMLWDYLKKDPEHKDRRLTGWGSKTKQGLVASIARVVVMPLPPKGTLP